MDNDVISRSALKNAFKAWKTMDDYYHDTDCNDIPLSEAFDLIDNAPIVAYPFEKFRIMLCGTCQANMRIEPDRPQGEWVKVVNKISECETETHWECSECHNPDFRLGEAEFCSFCGASMKGGTE